MIQEGNGWIGGLLRDINTEKIKRKDVAKGQETEINVTLVNSLKLLNAGGVTARDEALDKDCGDCNIKKKLRLS